MLNFPPTPILELLLPPLATDQDALKHHRDGQPLIPCYRSRLDFAALYVSCESDTFRFFGHAPAEWVDQPGEMMREFSAFWRDDRHTHGTPERLRHWLILFDKWEERGLPVSHYRKQFQNYYLLDNHIYPGRLCYQTMQVMAGQPLGSVAVDFTLKPGDLVFYPEDGPVRLAFTGRQEDGLSIWSLDPDQRRERLRQFLAHNWNWPQRAAELWEKSVQQLGTGSEPDYHRRVSIRRLLRQSGFNPD